MNAREVWRIARAGSLDRLIRIAEPLPDPAPGEARVRVHAIGMNFADLFACLGLYSATPKGPFVPGLEFAGVVEEFGPATDASTLHPGDRVMGLTRVGAQHRRAVSPPEPGGLGLHRGRRVPGTGAHGVVRADRAGRPAARGRGAPALGCRWRRAQRPDDPCGFRRPCGRYGWT